MWPLCRSVAVLVIACPCASGPCHAGRCTVGLGRAARQPASSSKSANTLLRSFRNIRQIVFDKTGTLTTGKLQIGQWKAIGMGDDTFRSLVFSLEKYSSHPIAAPWSRPGKACRKRFCSRCANIKGVGMAAKDKEGNDWRLGSYIMAKEATTDDSHSIYLLRNGALAGWIDFIDELRPEAKT